MKSSKKIRNFPPAPPSVNSLENNIAINEDIQLKEKSLSKNKKIRIKKVNLNKKEINKDDINNNIPNYSIKQIKYRNSEDALKDAVDMIQKGYVPLFLKINDYRPIYFLIKEECKLKCLIKLYFEFCPEANEEVIYDIKLFCKKRYLDINSTIKDLNLVPLSIIRNIKSDSI